MLVILRVILIDQIEMWSGWAMPMRKSECRMTKERRSAICMGSRRASRVGGAESFRDHELLRQRESGTELRRGRRNQHAEGAVVPTCRRLGSIGPYLLCAAPPYGAMRSVRVSV